jgi:hypothetical protein
MRLCCRRLIHCIRWLDALLNHGRGDSIAIENLPRLGDAIFVVGLPFFGVDVVIE